MSERIIEAAQSIVTCAGAGALTVREILKRLNITNRVFYNRFHNIGEVLAIVYRNTVLKVRESISANVEGKDKDEFFTKEECLKSRLNNMKIVEFNDIPSISVSITIEKKSEPIIRTLQFIEK
jgi:AcrR family transcriptional regulator